MQILLTFRPETALSVPFNYNYQLQSAVYAVLAEAGGSSFWHDGGFGDASKFKGFCFSRLNGRYTADREKGSIAFEDDIYLEIRSASFEFIDSFQRAIERRSYLKLFDTRLEIIGASLANVHLESGDVTFTAETPVVARRTLEDGHTRFFSPDEEEFFARIRLNAERKYEAITGKKPDELTVAPCGEHNKTVVNYKGTYITGYTGRFELNTSLRMAEFLYNTGLGEKNSQGFGFVRLP